MSTRLVNFLIVILLVSLFTPESQAQQNLEKLLKSPILKNASVSMLVVDVTTGDTLFKNDPYRSLTPASTLKLFSTSTALELLGKDFTFKTEIGYSGTIDSNGTLNGDIYIIGHGDPCLGAERFGDFYYKPDTFLNIWVKSIQDAGIKKVNGRIIGDPSEFCFPFQQGTWHYGDVGNYYGAPVSGLSIYENTYNLFFATGFFDGDSTRLLGQEPVIPGMKFINRVISKSTGGDQAYIFGGAESNNRIIKGSLPTKQNKFKIKGAIPNPPLFAAQELQQHLIGKGITVSGDAVVISEGSRNPIIKPLFISNSPVLKRICDATNLWSLNLYAETLAVQCGLTLKSKPDNSYESIKNFWKMKGMNTEGLYIVDGSGLSGFNAVNAAQLVFLLQYMKTKSSLSEEFESTLPVAGNSGTLTKYCMYGSAKNRIHAKGGSMTRVRSMAGYAETKTGKQLAFAIIINNYDEKGEIKALMEEILNAIAEM
ncbi:MAG: D-alanyl-D-alanine carboxypeptidase/D-alanyl-D-alanine-endopeptidase [Bacteroidales bacterium]|nr:D-alanyl-D-alanine carboxypeptidase/D-alanyl-D-alanine-endopeptidase [Bacteroidales bacterium]HQN92832.1 D-alanyl-D-alanine carboxypeptidase/D-alanyl-D-alanine-endopeptidase [Prolixibacteraceae bacterium]